MSRPNGAVTIKDIAQVLGLSAKAVSSGLNNTGRLAPDTRKRIQETAKRMGYTPNIAARALVTRRSSFIGVVMPFLNSSFFSNIIAGIEEVAGDNNFTLLLDGFSFDPERQQRTLSHFAQRDIDGLILYPQRKFLPLAAQINALGVPVVQIMNRFDEFGDYAVTVDNFNAGREAARHLVGLGHTRIAIVSHDTESPELTQRRLGFESVIREYGLDSQMYRIDSPLSEEGGIQAGVKLLRLRPAPSAIFCCSDVAALGIMRTALEFGKKIPEELSILGFDDLELAARQLIYPLSTMAQPKELSGKLAARMLLRLIRNEPVQSQQLEAPLIVRATTAKPSPAYQA